MRLIDADKLEPSATYKGGEFVRIVYMDDIDEMSTVEAIPIEFIKRFVTFFPPTPTYIYGEESIDMDAWCEELLEHWEKENETN